ncbi:AAA family ATPase [Acinetobacter ursingii]|uniref:AAA family ATPase n=1 Tax=Acinetobacter ursingii TaxID=108980 RepID=UPI0030089597
MTFASDRFENNQDTIVQQNYAFKSAQQAMRTSRFQFEPEHVMRCLRENIVGQEQALIEIENMLKVVKADFNAPERPLSVTLMLGPTGIGKTETVRVIAQAIYGRADAMCRIDMNTLAQEHYAAALTGAPPGYVGSKEGHTLFDLDAIQGSFSKPGIVLFDEIEKASTEVIRALLNVIETGMLQLTAGTKSIDFRNCMIFMTSNIGAKQSQARISLLERFPQFTQHWAKKLNIDATAVTQRALTAKFDPEFLNRIDRILHYAPVEADFLPKLIQIELNKLNQRLKKQGRTLWLSPTAILLLQQNYEPYYGARGVSRQIRTRIEPLLATEFIRFPEVNHFYIDSQDQQFVVNYLSEGERQNS